MFEPSTRLDFPYQPEATSEYGILAQRAVKFSSVGLWIQQRRFKTLVASNIKSMLMPKYGYVALMAGWLVLIATGESVRLGLLRRIENIHLI